MPVVTFFWGDPAPCVGRCRAAGIKVGHRIGSAAAAKAVVDAGVDFVIAQGQDAGGHLSGDIGTLALVPRVVDAAGGVPVAAAGGITDARGVVAAMALGAEAAVLGTRFLASVEANAHPVYKEHLVAAAETETARTTLFDAEWPDAPHRVLRTPFAETWLDRPAGERRASGQPAVGATRIAGREFTLSPLHGVSTLRSGYRRHRADVPCRRSGRRAGYGYKAGGDLRAGPRCRGRADHSAAAGCAVIVSGYRRSRPVQPTAACFLASRPAIASSRCSNSVARSTTGTSIILPSTVTAPTPSASALS